MEQLELELEDMPQQELGLAGTVRTTKIHVTTIDHHYGFLNCGQCDYRLPEPPPSECPECEYTLQGTYHRLGFGGSDF